MAVEDLEACVKEILCGLSDAILREIQLLINGQVAVLQSAIATIQVQIIQYDIASFPVQFVAAAAEAIIDEVRSTAGLIPLAQITNCVDLGDFNLNINQSLDQATAVFDDVVYEATRLLSYTNELNSTVTQINNAITQFTDISFVIDECIAESEV